MIAMLTIVGAAVACAMVATSPFWLCGVLAGRRPGPTPMTPPIETRLRRWTVFIGSVLVMVGSFYGMATWNPLVSIAAVPGYITASWAAYSIGAAWWNAARPRPTSHPAARLTTHPDPAPGRPYE